MRIQKLDNRFKMKRAGLATHMAVVDVPEIQKANEILSEAYGSGSYVASYQKAHQIRNKGDWFYSAEYQINDARYNKLNPQRPPETKLLVAYRFYFRREEQATYLSLAMS